MTHLAAIDLDGVLTLDDAGPYAERRPDLAQIDRLRRLRARDWRVTIWTARKATPENRLATLRWLRAHGIPFDRLVLGKPRVDLVVDDRAASEIPLDLDDFERRIESPRHLRTPPTEAGQQC